MDAKDFADWEQRVAARARALWEAQGRPDGGPDHFVEQARELLAIAENPQATTRPVTPEPEAEPLLAVENQGEFPTLTDQGEERTYPLRREDGRREDAADGT